MSCLVRISKESDCNMQGVALGWATFWTPQPLRYDAPVDVFSEGRAMATVRKLSEDIGVRLVRAQLLPLLYYACTEQAKKVQGNLHISGTCRHQVWQ